MGGERSGRGREYGVQVTPAVWGEEKKNIPPHHSETLPPHPPPQPERALHMRFGASRVHLSFLPSRHRLFGREGRGRDVLNSVTYSRAQHE